MIEEIRRKISWINFATIVLMILISFSVVAGIFIIGNESVNIQNSILVTLRLQLQSATENGKDLGSERQRLFQYYFSKKDVNDAIIDEYVFEAIKKYNGDKRFRGKSANDIVADVKLYEYLIYDLGGPYYVGWYYNG